MTPNSNSISRNRNPSAISKRHLFFTSICLPGDRHDLDKLSTLSTNRFIITHTGFAIPIYSQCLNHNRFINKGPRLKSTSPNQMRWSDVDTAGQRLDPTTFRHQSRSPFYKRMCPLQLSAEHRIDISRLFRNSLLRHVFSGGLLSRSSPVSLLARWHTDRCCPHGDKGGSILRVIIGAGSEAIVRGGFDL